MERKVFKCMGKKRGTGMKEKLIRFMQGRYGMYGADSMNRFLLGGALAAMVASVFFRWDFLYAVALAALVYAYFRMFSRNYTKRYAENQAFLRHTSKIRMFWASQKSLMGQRKTHHIYQCPGCRQKIRIPRGKGKIMVKCPRCGREFKKKS